MTVGSQAWMVVMRTEITHHMVQLFWSGFLFFQFFSFCVLKGESEGFLHFIDGETEILCMNYLLKSIRRIGSPPLALETARLWL